jgi:hypothetical protein
VLFTSNWEKTLGTDPVGEAGTAARQDVFLVALAPPGLAAPRGLRLVGSGGGTH